MRKKQYCGAEKIDHHPGKCHKQTLPIGEHPSSRNDLRTKGIDAQAHHTRARQINCGNMTAFMKKRRQQSAGKKGTVIQQHKADERKGRKGADGKVTFFPSVLPRHAPCPPCLYGAGNSQEITSFTNPGISASFRMVLFPDAPGKRSITVMRTNSIVRNPAFLLFFGIFFSPFV